MNMDARLKERVADNWKPGSRSEINVKCAVDFYEEYHNDRLIYRFDPLNFHRIVDGVDQLTDARISLGLTTAVQ
jgi:P2 family phage contractile tail tube protein